MKNIKTNRKNLLKSQKGMGLVEVIAALGITLVTITSLVSLALYTMRSSLQSKLTLEGAKIASREMELVRGYRDRSATWADFTTGLTDNTCLVNPGTGVCHMETGTMQPANATATETIDNQAVVRSFTADIDDTDPNIVYISVTVSWEVAGQARQTNLYTYLTNWRND